VKRLVIALMGVVLLAAAGFVVAAANVQQRHVRRELEAADRFVSVARAHATELRKSPPGALACDGPLTSADSGKRLFGATHFAAYVSAPEGQSSAEANTEILVGNDGCARPLAFIDAFRDRASGVKQVGELLRSPGQLDRAFDEVDLPICMSTRMTDFGVVLLAEQVSQGEGGSAHTRATIEIFDFPAGRVRCRGTVSFESPKVEAPGPKRDQQRARAFSEVVSEVIEAAKSPAGEGAASD
jgi:hypothetical protein